MIVDLRAVAPQPKRWSTPWFDNDWITMTHYITDPDLAWKFAASDAAEPIVLRCPGWAKPWSTPGGTA